MTRRISSGTAGSTVQGAGQLTITGSTIAAGTPNTSITLDPTGTGVVSVLSSGRFTNGTNSSNSTTGGLVVTGGVGMSGNLTVGSNISAANGIDNNAIGVSPNTANTATFSNLTLSGIYYSKYNTETIDTKTNATGVVVHNFNDTNTWWHSSISANFTVNLTNVPTTTSRVINITLNLVQGAVPYLATGFQIDGVAQTIVWSGRQIPTPSAGRTEVQTFTLYRVSAQWYVISSLTSFGVVLNGSSAATAAVSGLAIKGLNPSATSGVYWIQTQSGATQTYVDMTNVAGGGWTLIGKSGGGLWSNPTGWLKSNVSTASLQNTTLLSANNYACLDARAVAGDNATEIMVSNADFSRWVRVEIHSNATNSTIFNHADGQTTIYNDAIANSQIKTAYAWNGGTTTCFVNKYMIMALSTHGGSTPAWTLNTPGNTNVGEYAFAIACASNTTFNGFSAGTYHNGMDAPYDATWPNTSYNSGMFLGNIWVR